MVKVKITFSDGSNRIYTFSTQEKVDIFLNTEGKNVRKVEYL